MQSYLLLSVALLFGCHPTTAPSSNATLAEPRASHGASLLGDGTILVTGGFRKGPDRYTQIYSDSTEVFDPKTNTVVLGPPMQHARAGHVIATLLDGSVLVAGGWDAHGVVRSAEVFDPGKHAFTTVGDLAQPRGGATATRLRDGRVLVIGGGEDGHPLASIESYDPATHRWRATGALVTPRAGHTATLLADGRVLVVGGATAAHDVVASAELYDPATERSALTGSLATPRYKHAAVLRANGDVMVIAGSDDQDWRGKYATTEIYSPRTATFRPGPQLAERRFKLPNTVLALPDGDIAIAGGAPTIEVLHGNTTRTATTLDAAVYYGTATLLPASRELVVIGGYDDKIRVSAAVRRFSM